MTDGDNCGSDFLLFERLAGIQHRVMFDCGNDDVLASGSGRAHHAEDCEIVCFRAAAGENNFGGSGADERGDRFSGAVHSGAGGLSGRVDGAGVAEIFAEIGQHRGEDCGLHRCGRVVIKIRAHVLAPNYLE